MLQCLVCSYFNSRPSARGDENHRAQRHHGKNFNSRPSARGDCAFDAVYNPITHFNSRPSARGDGKQIFLAKTLKFQFTPLREGRRGKIVTAGTAANISIHAPPRGATNIVRNIPTKEIFQFTPLREGRRFCRPVRCIPSRHFNSRPSARGDASPSIPTASKRISIHAPPRGATMPYPDAPKEERISIHAPPRGATKFKGGWA